MLGITRLQVRQEIGVRQQSKIRDAVAYAKLSKVRWAGHVMRHDDNCWTRVVSDCIPQEVKRTQEDPMARFLH